MRPPAAPPRGRAWHVRLVLAWLVTWLALTGCAVRAETVLLQAAISVSGSGQVFPTDRPATPVHLPDNWARSRPGSEGPVWYRVPFHATGVRQGGELLALFVEHVCSNLEVFVNGQRVHSGGRMDEPITHNCNRPQLIALPAALLIDGVNALDLKVVGHALAEVASGTRAGSLSVLRIGPLHELAPVHAREVALNVSIPQALSATLLLMGSFMFVLGFMNRRESHLAYFGALSIGWAFSELRLWLPDLPFPNSVSEFLLCAMLPFVTLAAVQFLLRSMRWRHRWIDTGLMLQCAVMPLSLAAAGPGQLYPVVSFWYALLSIEVGTAAAWYLRHQWSTRRAAFWPTASLLAAVVVCTAFDFLARRVGVRSLGTQLAQLATPLILVAVGLRLVQQHGRALVSAEEDKATLEARVREATLEIERNFAQLSELRVEQVTERERKRIAADLHDDLGAKLLTIVHTSESERISTLAREALEEMRLSVRGLTGKPVRLIDALGDWRAEMVSRLAQAGIEADWSAPAEDLPQTLSARAFVQTTRILRESVSNIIKHSGASHASIRCSISEGDFQLVVQDNGGGIPMELDGRLDRGHGVASMKHRAKQLHGQCLVESGPGFGTVIRLTLPLEGAVETP